MLNSDFCKKCYAIYDIREEWSKMTTNGRWTYNAVACPVKKDSDGKPFYEAVFVDEPPPEWCRFRFEHAVSAGMNDVK